MTSSAPGSGALSKSQPWPPGPKSVLPGIQWFAFRRDPIAFLRQAAREYGDVTSFQIASQRIVFVNDPAIIQDILVTQARQFHKGRGLERAKRMLGEGLLTSEGEKHLRQRRLVQPAFHRQRLADYGRVMVDYAQRLDLTAPAGESSDIAVAMMHLTLVVVGRTLFNADVVDGADQITADVNEMVSQFRMLLHPLAGLLERLPLPAVARFHRSRARLDAVIYRMINEHRENGSDQHDLLSMLMDAHDEDGDRLSDVQIRDEVMTLFLAGHETTSNALTWTWLLLSQNPDAEALFHEELRTVLGGRKPSFDDLAKLPYTRAVFAESMRMYPPAWIIGRRAMADYAVQDYVIPARTVFVMSQAVMHRDERWYNNPDQFDPGRWLREGDTDRPKFAYFPFGGGPRVCVGEQFAWMEGILLLATLGQRWQFRLDPNQRVALAPGITLRPRFGMNMYVESRG